MLGQTFSLYNVAGLIDKNKNIYYVPHQNKLYEKVLISNRVCNCYKALLDEVCPSSTKYTDVEISQWSPEDRVLRVVGTIDDFRVSRGQGLALNYCVVRRIVDAGEGGERTYYYSFFIDSVRQAGANSVELIMSPDHFTNFYYFNNEEVCTPLYDPFNPVMKNCFVERQHYDRFKNNSYHQYNLDRINQEVILGSQESFNYKYQFKDLRLVLPLSYNISVKRFEEMYKQLINCIDAEHFVEIFTDFNEDERKCMISVFINYLNITFKENYLFPITYGRKDDDFYYQYKPARAEVGGYHSPLTQVVVPFISIPYELEGIISPEWIVPYIVLNYADNKLRQTYTDDPSKVLDYFREMGASNYILTAFVSKYSPVYKTIEVSIEVSEAITLLFNVDIIQNGVERISKLNSSGLPTTPDKFVTPAKEINLSNFAPALLPLSKATKSGKLADNLIVTEKIATISTLTPPEVPSDTYVPLYTANNAGGIFVNPVDIYVQDDSHPQQEYTKILLQNYTPRLIGIVLSTFSMESFWLTLDEIVDKRDITRGLIYFEPLLESDPYSFYSLSINETEQILSKMRYYNTYNNGAYNIVLEPFVSYNDAYKIGIIPLYRIETYERIRYYSEGLVSVINSQVPFVEDSWLTYYSLNKAQMKNQYAVQQNSYASSQVAGITQDIFDTLGNTFSGVATGSEGQAVTGLVKGTSRAVGHLIANAESNAFAMANISRTQQAKMGDMGAKPDTVKLAGSDILYELSQRDLGIHINHYRIDKVSYDSIAKYLERNGYLVKIYDSLNIYNRVGLNYIQLSAFEFVEDTIKISEEQNESISNIFSRGVTLLHDRDYLHSLGEKGYHNFETSLLSTTLVNQDISIINIRDGYEVVMGDIDESLINTAGRIQTGVNNLVFRRRRKSDLSIIEERRISRVAVISSSSGYSISLSYNAGGRVTPVRDPISIDDYESLDEYWTIEYNKEGGLIMTNSAVLHLFNYYIV